MNKISFSVLGYLLGFFLIISCSNENDPAELKDLQLVISPTNLELTLDEIGTVLISSQPQGSFEWQIGNKPNWINLSPNNGIVDGNISEITVTTDVSNLSYGWNSGSVEIISSAAGKKSFDISVYRDTPLTSMMSISEEMLEFDYLT
ncbi:hypothetical protein [Maribacter sp. 4G9]|uniref:hypothetical protein n=1 Tax=Maribacter sp. 4G9 TaxID=1889777 RepID=UPI000C14A43C|nr:hypothetical protein [Maribacter sp. 4G9]PIB27529.1 hypothetical protein BFP75_00455 [Maribacter sp. 4G9]